MSELFSVANKRVLVTGGSRGVGLMIAHGFVAAGARVYIAARDEKQCARAAAELSAWGECEALPADVASDEGCKDLVQRIRAREDVVHVLVNNAGLTLGAPLDDFGEAEWDRVLDVNVKGAFFLTKHLRPLLEAAARPLDPARVINIGSIDGIHVPAVENYSYTASKAALHHLTRHLAKRLGPRLTVNAVALGPFESEMTQAALGDEMAERTPLRRVGRPEDVAGVCIYLASQAGAFVTGAVLPVDGGLATTA